MRCSIQSAGALGNEIGRTLDVHRDLVEQLVDGDAVRASNIPVRLFQLAVQIDCRRQMLVQQLDRLWPGRLGQTVACKLHARFSMEEAEGLPIHCRSYARRSDANRIRGAGLRISARPAAMIQ